MNVAATAALGDQPGRLVRFHGLFNAGVVAGALSVGIVLRSGVSWRWIWLATALAAFVLAQWCQRVPIPAGAVGERRGLLDAIGTVRREGLVLLAGVFATAAGGAGGGGAWGVLFLRGELASGVGV